MNRPQTTPRRRMRVRHLVPAALILLAVLCGQRTPATAQALNQWSPSLRIPEFQPETWPPLLLPDGNRTVHAISSQWLGQEGADLARGIVYSRWTLAEGWTTPVDVLLPPLKDDARLTGAYLDHTGMIHVTFFSGDNTYAGIYYARVYAGDAGRAFAWSEPLLIDQASDPEVAAVTGDANGNMVIVYGGRREGLGLYSTFSVDGGNSWSIPELDFPTNSALIPVTLSVFLGETGVLHTVWDVRTPGGQGRAIYYAGLQLGAQQWSEPVTLEEVTTSYGVLLPTVVEHNGELFVAYSGIVIRRSSDGGQTWSDPISPFRQTGVNGAMTFVVDSADILHLLWAQRITGNPDIHGVWHSAWRGGLWSEPEPVVSGPQVQDLSGDKAFDPFEVRAAVSQGNMLLVTWRQDPGLKANGVWYSRKGLDAPELPVVPLPTPVPPATPTPVVLRASAPAVPSTPTASPAMRYPALAQPGPTRAGDQATGLLMAAVAPISLVLAVVLAHALRTRYRRRL